MARKKGKSKTKKMKIGRCRSFKIESSRRFETAGKAADELYGGFNDWSSSIAAHGMQAAYSIIAANWAVHGDANGILSNSYAKTSMTIIVSFIGLNLLLTGWMTILYKRRINYANDDKGRWNIEFEKENDRSSSWPYTTFIEQLGSVMRFLKVSFPILAGVIFVLSLFCS